DLVGLGAHGGGEVDPVGVAADVGVGARGLVVEVGAALALGQALLLAVVVVGELGVAAVADAGDVAVAVQKAAVVDDGGVAAAVAEAVAQVAEVVVEDERGAGGERLGEPVDLVAHAGVVVLELGGAVEAELADLELVAEHEVDGGDRLGGLVDEVEGALEGGVAALGVNVDAQLAGDDARLREVLVLLVVALVGG